MERKSFSLRINVGQLTTKDLLNVIMGCIANVRYSKQPRRYYTALENLLTDYMPRKVIRVTGQTDTYDGFYSDFILRYGEECEIIERVEYKTNEYNLNKCEMDYKEHFCFRPVSLYALYIVEGNRIVVPIWSLTGKYQLVPCEDYSRAPQLHVCKNMCMSDDRIEKVVTLVLSGKFQRREDTASKDYWPMRERTVEGGVDSGRETKTAE